VALAVVEAAVVVREKEEQMLLQVAAKVVTD
jgi:hypothetical protein